MPEVILDVLEKIYIWAQIIIGLGFLIFIHEAGHFLVAKWKGVRVDAFSLGMGPILWKRLWRGTEYRVSAIPLGGYVKMAGENIGDPKTGAPDELTSKPAFARLQIFAAGALMNLVIAFPLAILACLAGRSEGSTVIGKPSYADTVAGLKPGDKLLLADGKKVESAEDYRKTLVRLPQGRSVEVVVERDGKEITTKVDVMDSKKHITFPPPTTLPKIKRGSPAYEAGLRDHAEILEINGEEPLFSVGELNGQLARAGAEGTLDLAIRNPGEEKRRVSLKGLPVLKDVWIEKDFRLIEPVIASPETGSPAGLAGLQAGDVIQKIDDQAIASFKDILDAVEARAGKEVAIEFKRGGSTKSATTLILYKYQDKGYLGVGPGRTPKIVEVAEGTPFHKAGLRSGDVLVTISGLKDPATDDLAKGRFGPVDVQVRRGEETISITVQGSERKRLKFDDAGFFTEKGALLLAFNRIERRWGFRDAIVAGLYEPLDVIDITFRILRKLFVREEDPSGLAGPVGIFKASFAYAETGLGNFLWILVLITVNLGIFNLLPVPVLDGGHILLLGIEKVRGAPPSPGFVERFQLVGLILLLSLLIFVTVNDLR